MVIDEGARGHHAAAFSLLVGRDGKFRVMLDLLKQNSTDRYERTWEHDLFVTMLTIDREKLTRTDFSPEELQRIGQLVVGELAVLYRIQTEM